MFHGNLSEESSKEDLQTKAIRYKTKHKQFINKRKTSKKTWLQPSYTTVKNTYFK
jgi:hypothetical protein